ncbi:MAG: response regulator [Elusimicrobiota bacterium]
MSDMILIIDDDPLVGLVVEAYLADIGCPIQLLSDSLSAMEVIKRKKPSLILLDLCMPGIDGLTLCRRLKADPETRDLPIVAISGSAKDADRRAILAQGAEAFIKKPFDSDSFPKEIAEILARHA